MITSIGWDCVSELRPPTGLLVIPQMIYEHGDPWWNHIDRENPLVNPPALSGNSTSSAKSGGTWRRRCDSYLALISKFSCLLNDAVPILEVLQRWMTNWEYGEKRSCCSFKKLPHSLRKKTIKTSLIWFPGRDSNSYLPNTKPECRTLYRDVSLYYVIIFYQMHQG
jgi:hypothetical protein